MSDAYSAGKGAVGDTGGAAAPSGGISPLGIGALGAGALGIGLLLGNKPQLPWQTTAATGRVPGMWQKSGELYGEGQQLVGDAEKAYAMAQRGELTPQQQAQLKLMTTAEHNKASQMFAGMGRDITKDTTGLSVGMDIDARALAASQQMIQSTIALATSEMQGGASLMGQALGWETAADKLMMDAAQQQIALDKQYSDSMAAAFKAIGSIVAVAGGAMIGGPAGAMAGASLAKAL